MENINTNDIGSNIQYGSSTIEFPTFKRICESVEKRYKDKVCLVKITLKVGQSIECGMEAVVEGIKYTIDDVIETQSPNCIKGYKLVLKQTN